MDQTNNFELCSLMNQIDPPVPLTNNLLSNASSLYTENPAKIFPKQLNQKATLENRQQKKRDAIKINNHLPRKIEGKYNAEEVRILKAKLKKNDSACVVISCIGLFIALIEGEIFYLNMNVANESCFLLRCLVTVSCFVLHFFIYTHYKLKIEILKSLRIIYSGTNFWDSNLIKYYVIESLFCWIHSPPGLDFNISMKMIGDDNILSLNSLIAVIMLGRFYIFMRLFDHYTFWTSERAVRVCRLMGFQPDTLFAVKALLKHKAILMVSLSLGITTFLFGYLVRTFERDGNVLFNFKVIWNCIWCVIVTMATIGYGDIYPVTFLGRMVMIVACIWGVFLLSMFVVTLNNIIQLTKEEGFAYDEIMISDKIKANLSKDAKKIIALFLKLHWTRNKKDLKKKMLIRMDMLGLIKRFKIKRTNVQNKSRSFLEQMDDIHDSMTLEMNDLMECFEPVKEAMPLVEESEKIQGRINEKTVQIFQNSMRIQTLLITLSKGKKLRSINDLNDIQPLYDHKGILILKNTEIPHLNSGNTINNVLKP